MRHDIVASALSVGKEKPLVWEANNASVLNSATIVGHTGSVAIPECRNGRIHRKLQFGYLAAMDQSWGGCSVASSHREIQQCRHN